MPERIPLFDLKLASETKRMVREVLNSGWLNTGARAKELEERVADLVGVRYAVAVNSASSGLQLSLEALGVGTGHQVITTPFTFTATVAAILRTGAIPVLADIDPATLNIDPDEVARKITPDTKAVIPVDIAGLPVDYKRLRKICSGAKIPVIADAAHSLGARIGAKSIAQMADAAVHSFQATKNLTTADGGMVLSRHKPFVKRVRLLSQHGMTANAHQRIISKRWEYDVSVLGAKANLTDLHAAVGLGQLSVFEKNQAKRVRLAERYRANLGDMSELLELPLGTKHYRHAWHLFIIRLRLSALKIDRDQFMAAMARAGIECGVHYKPLFEMSYYRQHGFRAQHFPNAAYAGQRVVSLPLYPTLRLSQVDRICDSLRQAMYQNRR